MVGTARRRRGRTTPGSALMALFSLVTVVFVSTPLFLTGPSAVEPSSTVAPSTTPQLAWIQWTAPASYPNSATITSYSYTYATQALGTIAIPGGSTVYVKFTGEIVNSYSASGFGIASNSYWSVCGDCGGGAAFKSDNVPDLPTNGDRIGVSGSYTGGVQVQTLEFFSDASRTVPAAMTNLVMDIWSLGRPAVTGTWNFTQNFDILSDNAPPVSSRSGLTKGAGGPPYSLNGNEGTGTLQFNGSYSSLAWTVMAPEFYATWNIGVTTATAPSDPSITPSTSTITAPVGTPITPVTFTDKEFVGAVTYAVKSGTLPAGLTLNPATGEITGTPTSPASATVVIEATGATSGVADATLDFTITAPSPFTVTFDVNGGTGTMGPQSSSTSATLTGSTFTRSGYTFAGWNTAPDGSGTAYADGADYPFTSSVTLYAQWTLAPVVTTTSTTSTTIAPIAPTRSALPLTGAQILTFSFAGSMMLVVGFALYAVAFVGSPAGGRALSSVSRGTVAAVAVVRERARRRDPNRRRRPVADRAPVAVRPAPTAAPPVVLEPLPTPALRPQPLPAPVVEVPDELVTTEPEPVVDVVVEPVVPAPELVSPQLSTEPVPAWTRAHAVVSSQLADEWASADRVAAAAYVASLRSRLRRLDGVAGEPAEQWRARIQSELRAMGVSLD